MTDQEFRAALVGLDRDGLNALRGLMQAAGEGDGEEAEFYVQMLHHHLHRARMGRLHHVQR